MQNYLFNVIPQKLFFVSKKNHIFAPANNVGNNSFSDTKNC